MANELRKIADEKEKNNGKASHASLLSKYGSFPDRGKEEEPKKENINNDIQQSNNIVN